MRYVLNALLRARYSVRLEIRRWLDGFALFFAITLFFCLTAATIDWHQHRIRAFDKDAWWYPIYMTLRM
jgi:hypothetical protein